MMRTLTLFTKYVVYCCLLSVCGYLWNTQIRHPGYTSESFTDATLVSLIPSFARNSSHRVSSVYRPRAEHMFLISATYFSRNKSYPANTMVLLFNANRGAFENEIICWSRNSTHESVQPASTFQVSHANWLCRWEAFLSQCPVVPNPVEFGITTTGTAARPRVPFRDTEKLALGVVACISPQFCIERWQILVHMLEIYRQFSVDRQVYYFDSMLTEIYDLLKVYERVDGARIVYWPKIVVDARTSRELGYDPSRETEVKNQPTAYNDCLLQYKDAAEFIMFGDTDDVLYPRNGHTYLDEFRLLSRMFPTAGAFLYPRYTGNFDTSRFSRNYSLRQLIDSVQITDQWVSEKYVGIPSRVNVSYIHWPAKMTTGFEQQHVPRDFNMMVHFRRWRKVDKSTGNLPMFIIKHFRNTSHGKPSFDNIHRLVSADRVSSIESAFRTFIKSNAVEEFRRLPTQIRYYPIFEKCYDNMIYGRKKMPKHCVGHTKCIVKPVAGLRCSMLRARYSHSRITPTLSVHFVANPIEVVVNNNGCIF